MFSQCQRVNVYKNDEMTWDYTVQGTNLLLIIFTRTVDKWVIVLLHYDVQSALCSQCKQSSSISLVQHQEGWGVYTPPGTTRAHVTTKHHTTHPTTSRV